MKLKVEDQGSVKGWCISTASSLVSFEVPKPVIGDRLSVDCLLPDKKKTFALMDNGILILRLKTFNQINFK